MSYNPGDDFASLVSRANPAAQQNPYGQPGRSTYAPQAGSSQPTLAPSVDDRYKLDPFFDDDDDQQTPHATATTFPPSVSAPTPRHPGRQPSLTILDEPLDSSADLPLTKAAAPPAGRSFNDAGSSGMQQQNSWAFEDDDGLPAPNSRYERGGQPRNAPLRQQTKRTWKWPWEKQKALAPERKIWLNDRASNETEGYSSNYVSTTKYNLVTFVPKFLLEQFSKYANVFFLFTACIQQIPGVSPTNPYTTIVPLALVLLASAFKETQEDLKRHQSDAELNARKSQVLSETGSFSDVKWRHIRVGDIVRLESDDFIPADLLLLSSSEPEGLCYIETSNLDGETNLKIKQGSGAKALDFGGAGSGGGKESLVVKEFLTLLAVCHTVIPEVKGEKIVYQASSPDEAALVSGAELLGFRFHLTDRFQTRKPKSVFVEVGGTTQEFEILNVCEFNSTRKRMSTIVRGPDGKIKLYCKGADTVIFERLGPSQTYVDATMVHLEDYATEGLRTLCIAMRDIPEAEYQEWAAIYDQAAATINGRGEALDQAAELIEKDMFLLGATAIEDKLQEGVPDAIHTLQMAGIKVWVLTGDRQETAINIGLSCRLISESMNLVIVNEETAQTTKDFISKRLVAIKNQRKTGEQEDLALIIDGKSLTFALEKDISKTFLELAMLCKAVVCCRVSPLQKALVVKLVKKNTKSILLAIGDGANDVSMIQAAHIGVGISGVEGLQAARSADVAISQFRYLKKLLLVHGAWSYQRLSKLILYSFYKNIVLYMTQFWYSFFNNFSGQIANESWTLSFYNVLFTVLPPLVLGIFDQFVSARILDRYPQLYMLGQKNAFFTRTAFWMWVVNALYHSLILFGFSIIMFWGDLKSADGRDSGHWFWGTSLYMAVLLTVLGKAALISEWVSAFSSSVRQGTELLLLCSLWTKYTVAAMPGSFLFTMIFLPIYCLVAPALGFSPEYGGIVPRLFGDGPFYFSLLLLPYRRTYHPASYHIAQELQKYNIPDYRPRQEQFQKAIKKVRAVQRMRKNRGFAFSQTEDPNGQEQARLIRAYDTSQVRPSDPLAVPSLTLLDYEDGVRTAHSAPLYGVITYWYALLHEFFILAVLNLCS
ncbi:hypothetical protein M407DRAFT_228764 [Tulasnella calospora MUT 4182]|uniref:Phospholipid-transporting ATPase n=1 Tax=Tulasnella calospora MUT 4182 TaxID=1051891 RepID=A0A0C3QMJ9_9AGAM|nr:hypothetical protein M407DRAFT_228764 [Tulasnella calospora MUT 4182]